MIDLQRTVAPFVRETARSVSSTYPSFVSSQDTEQALWIWVYAKKEKVLRLLAGERWDGKLRRALQNEAVVFCSKEKAAVIGYSIEDLFNYSIPVIKELLVDVFDYESWQSFASFGDGQPKSKGQANETGDRVASLVDVKKALSEIPEEAYNLIVWHYKYNWTNEMLGEELGVSTAAAEKRLQRAVGAVQRKLGRQEREEYQQPARRRPGASNASAMSDLYQQYEG